MNRDALVVGINRYPFLSHLSTPAFDAEAIAQMLKKYGCFRVRRFPEIVAYSTIQVDPNTVVTAADLENAISQLFLPNGNSIPDTALLFFAGHGLRRQLENTNLTEGYLATSDASPRKEKWGISLKWLRELLQQSPVRQQIVWLDCCNSGELFNFTEDDLLNESKKQYFFITASREFEPAYPSLSTQHGALTEVLLKGLDPTRNSEELINNFTLTRFIEENLRQTPQKGMIKCGDREILLTCTDRYRLESLILKQNQQNPTQQSSTTPLLTWKYAHSLTGHLDEVKSVAISPDGTLIASGSLDKIIKLWLIDTGELLHTIAGHSSAVLSLAFSPNGQTLASASNMEFQGATIKLWNVSTGKLQTTLGNSLLALRTSCLAFSPDGLTLASGHLDAKIRLWNLGNCQIRGTLKSHGWDVNSLAFSRDGKILVSGGLDGAIKIWNWHKEELLNTLNRPAPSELIPSLVSWFDSSVSGIWSVAISPDGKTIASGGSDQPINLWDADTGKLLRILTEHSDSVYTVAFSPDGKILASGGDDHTIRIWEFQTGKLLKTLEHLGPVKSIAFSPDGQTLVSGSTDATVKIWQRF